MLYNIYTGLSGSFGGATYKGTLDCKDSEDAEYAAYDLACEEYDSYAGLHSLRDWGDIKEENPEESDDEIDRMYEEEMENWIDYYATPTDEDDIEEDEIFKL